MATSAISRRILVPELEEARAIALCDACPVGSLSIAER
jgi:hypothetical protein